MATGCVETPEVMVYDSLIPVDEFDRVRRPVCLLRPSTADPAESWSASGFYVNVKDQSHESVDCIMTNYHVYEEKQKYNQTMVAVFHHEGSSQKQTVEIPLVPCKLLASSEGKDLDYVLIRLNESMRRALADVKPIMADVSKLPSVRKGNTVYIIQHPGGKKKHFSQSTIRRVNPPFIEYYADTLKGSSGSPVFVAIKSSFLLVALHSAGVDGYTNSWNKGVLFSEIFNHLHTGRFTKPALPTPGDPAIPSTMESRTDVTKPALPTPGDPAIPTTMESRTVGTKDPFKVVTREDIRKIARDITEEWKELGRALGLSDSTLNIINADNPKATEKSYCMLMKWTQIKVSQANYGALSTGFADPTVERCELITKYC